MCVGITMRWKTALGRYDTGALAAGDHCTGAITDPDHSPESRPNVDDNREVRRGRRCGRGDRPLLSGAQFTSRGLLIEPARPGGAGFRTSSDSDVRRLRFIRQAKAASFTLDEIGELLAVDATDDRNRARELARSRIAALDASIAEMVSARQRSRG